MQEVEIMETLLRYAAIISSEITFFNAIWAFNTIWASFSNVIPGLKKYKMRLA